MKFLTQQETYSDKHLDFATFAKICNRQQAIKAREAITRADRAKKTLSNREILNKWAQMGNVVRYENIRFYWDGGMGILEFDNRSIAGATISDFEKLIFEKFGVRPKMLAE